MMDVKTKFDEEKEKTLQEIYEKISEIIDSDNFDDEYDENCIAWSMDEVISDMINLKQSIDRYRYQIKIIL